MSLSVKSRTVHNRKKRSEEHTSDSSHGYISYAVFCLKKKKKELAKSSSSDSACRLSNEIAGPLRWRESHPLVRSENASSPRGSCPVSVSRAARGLSLH